MGKLVYFDIENFTNSNNTLRQDRFDIQDIED